jgi:hypothetical protein
MEARRSAPHFGKVVVAALAASILLGAGTGTDDDWNAQIGDRYIEVGGSESAQDGSGGAAASGSGGPAFETLTITDCTGFMPDGTTPDFCSNPFTCPENDEPGAPVHVRVLNFQRELDPSTGEALTTWAYVGTDCVPFDDLLDLGVGEPPSLLALVIEEWRRVEIPAATINVVPPGGRTLVNFDTIVHTDAGDLSFPVTILGRDVVIYAEPVTYTWVFGDGGTSTTATPGVPYQDGEPVGSDAIVHRYVETGDVTLRVDVEYRAEFTVDGGSAQAIPGSADVTGTSADLAVVQARSQLVDPNQ